MTSLRSHSSKETASAGRSSGLCNLMSQGLSPEGACTARACISSHTLSEKHPGYKLFSASPGMCPDNRTRGGRGGWWRLCGESGGRGEGRQRRWGRGTALAFLCPALKTNRGSHLPHLNCLQVSYRHSLLVLPSRVPLQLRIPWLSVSLPPPPQTRSVCLLSTALLPRAEDEVAMGT